MSSEVHKDDLCRCCHLEGEFKSLYSPHYSTDIEEKTRKMYVCVSPIVYADILRECFNIEFLPVTESYQQMVNGICETCIQKLKDANHFRLQVQKCEEVFRKIYDKHVEKDVADLKLNIKEEIYCGVTNNTSLDTKEVAQITTKEMVNKSSNEVYKFEVEVFGGETMTDDNHNDDDYDDGDQLNGTYEVKETKLKNEDDNTKSIQSKRIRSKRPKESTLKTKRKVGRPKKTDNSTPIPDQVNTEDQTNLLLQNGVDYQKVEDSVQCSKCGIKLKNIHCLRIHVKFVHLKMPRYSCTLCSKVFQTLNLLTEHKRVDHNMDSGLECNVCGEKFNQKYYLSRHIKRFHDGEIPNTKKKRENTKQLSKTKPSDKSAEFPDVIKLIKRQPLFKMRENVDYKLVGDLVQCCRCDKTVSKIHNIRNHVKFKHLNFAKFTCPICSEPFMNTTAFTVHKYKEHNIDDRAKCNACDSVFNTKFQLNDHINSFHMLGEKYKCADCDYECFNVQHLRKHKFKHKTVKEFHCAYCQKSFLRKGTLVCHERIHTGDKRKVCKECGEAFVQKASLNYHMAKYHPGVKF